MRPLAILTRASLVGVGIIAAGVAPPAAGIVAAVLTPVAVSDSRRYGARRPARPVQPRGVAARRSKPAAAR